jgi:hypothetical protein
MTKMLVSEHFVEGAHITGKTFRLDQIPWYVGKIIVGSRARKSHLIGYLFLVKNGDEERWEMYVVLDVILKRIRMANSSAQAVINL